MNLFLDEKDEDAHWRKEVGNYRDEETEGYNIVPNFFISARMAEDLKYDDSIAPTSHAKQTHISRHFKNRLFDSDPQGDDIRLAFELRFSRQLFDDYRKVDVHKLSNNTFIDTTFDSIENCLATLVWKS